MPSNDNFRTCICKHITPLDTCPILRHLEKFWGILSHILSNFEQFWAVLSSFEQFWAVLSSFEQFWAVLSSIEQLWKILRSCFGPAWVICSNFEHFCWASLGHDMALSTLDNVQKMSQLRLLWDILLWLKKVADVNPTDLDPKTRSAIRVWYGFPRNRNLSRQKS